MFLTEEYKSDIISAFGVPSWINLDDGQRGVATSLFFCLYQLFVAELSKKISSREEEEPLNFNVNEMSTEGHGKIRHIGGWAVNSCLAKYRRYVVGNKSSSSSIVRERAIRELNKIHFLENNAVVPHEILQESTEYSDTLLMIEARQYRERGLLHISDKAYEFFLALEQERVNQININRLLTLKNDLVDDALANVLGNTELKKLFETIFECEGNGEKVGI
jgi:HPt (histidine-containing phosphotransfer) domain-containing protein